MATVSNLFRFNFLQTFFKTLSEEKFASQNLFTTSKAFDGPFVTHKSWSTMCLIVESRGAVGRPPGQQRLEGVAVEPLRKVGDPHKLPLVLDVKAIPAPGEEV